MGNLPNDAKMPRKQQLFGKLKNKNFTHALFFSYSFDDSSFPPPRPAMSVIFNEMIKKYSSYYSSTFIQFTLGFDSIHTKVEFGL